MRRQAMPSSSESVAASPRTAASWGVLRGVTTNPTLIGKEEHDFLPLVKEICSLVEGELRSEPVLESDNSITRNQLSPDGRHVALACYAGSNLDIFSTGTLERITSLSNVVSVTSTVTRSRRSVANA